MYYIYMCVCGDSPRFYTASCKWMVMALQSLKTMKNDEWWKKQQWENDEKLWENNENNEKMMKTMKKTMTTMRKWWKTMEKQWKQWENDKTCLYVSRCGTPL